MNVGIIGVGQMGKNHLRVINSFKKNIGRVFIYDANTEVSNYFAYIYNVNQCNSIKSLLEKVDAVIIATPSSTHYEIAKLCLDSNKDIFIEKPITSKINEALQLVNLIDKTNCICMVGHIERFNPAILYMQEYIKGKEIKHITCKRISKLDKNRNFDIDVIVDLMIHDIDIVLSIVNSKPNKLFSASYDDFIDSAQAILQFENNTVATFNASRSSNEKIRNLYIYTRDEDIIVNFLEPSIEKIKQINLKKTFHKCSYKLVDERKKIFLEGEPLYLELEHFLNCIIARKKPISNEHNGLYALKIAEDLANCIKKGG